MTVSLLHDSPFEGVLFTTGGGSKLLSALLCEPGASNTVLDASVPYSESALCDLLGFRPRQACSAHTAQALAIIAFERAQNLSTSKDLFGIGLTASLATNRQKRGPHRAHLAIQTTSSIQCFELPLRKGALSRIDEERFVAEVALRKLMEVLELSTEESEPSGTKCAVDRSLQALFLGRRTCVGNPGQAFMPGAFNPLHEAHRRIREDAERRLECSVQFELCTENVDKPPLSYVEIVERNAQFDDCGDLVLTNKPTFLEKAQALRADAVTFVVGLDTLQRINDPKYYGDGSLEPRDRAHAHLRERGTRFLVYGRFVSGTFMTLADIRVSDDLQQMCDGVSESEFRMDLSSTQIRDRSMAQ